MNKKRKLKVVDFTPFYQAILEGNSEIFEETLKRHLKESISYMDSAENFYHGFLLGMLTGMQDYEILSNRESGEGRYDILLKPYDEKQPAICSASSTALRIESTSISTSWTLPSAAVLPPPPRPTVMWCTSCQNKR